MIKDWIGRREALLPINQNYDKIRETNKPSVYTSVFLPDFVDQSFSFSVSVLNKYFFIIIIEGWTIKRRYECWKIQQFTQQSAPQQREQNDAYYPITQAWRVHCPITLSNYKHDA